MTGSMIDRTFNNRYKITDRIGIGGMAEVYRAQDNVLGRVVAVKTMLPQYAADPTFTQRFRQEAAAAANLQSPYIVNVYDWGQDDGTYYIVMEYVRGSDLKTAIVERGSINQRKVAEIGSQVCQALNVAHSMDIIHRDIKPQNIMVQPDGNVKVMDFGIARAKNSVMTQTSSVLGTAHYISPEQAQGKELTPASDIYSLGIVLYEAATGVLPFDGPDAVSVALKQVNDLPALPSDINPDIDPDLEDIIMKSLEKKPQDRFDTANDMRLALNDYVAGRPVNLGDTFGGAKTAVIGGGVAAAGMAAAKNDGTAVMPAAGSGANSTNQAATNYRASNTGKKSNKKTIGIVIGIVAAIILIAGIAFAVLNMGDGTAVPDITGKTVEEATTLLENDGFSLGRQDSAYDSDVEKGKIISQDPEAQSKAAEGTKVNVIVSSGREPVTVPDLTGKSVDEAKRLLEDAGLKASAGTADYSADIEVNHVIRQDPAANSEAYKGDTVTYILSLGTEQGTVPDVTGKSRDEAISLIREAGFNASENDTAYSDTVSEGNVISQSPVAGFKGAKGSTVTITVSKGKAPEPEPDTVFVPDVSGQTQKEATSTLEALSLNVSATTGPSDSASKGKVLSQSVKNVEVRKGTTITLVIGDGSETASDPAASTTNTGSGS